MKKQLEETKLKFKRHKPKIVAAATITATAVVTSAIAILAMSYLNRKRIAEIEAYYLTELQFSDDELGHCESALARYDNDSFTSIPITREQEHDVREGGCTLSFWVDGNKDIITTFPSNNRNWVDEEGSTWYTNNPDPEDNTSKFLTAAGTKTNISE